MFPRDFPAVQHCQQRLHREAGGRQGLEKRIKGKINGQMWTLGLPAKQHIL